MIKKHIQRGFLLCLAVTLLVLGLYIFGGLDSLELKAVDFRFMWRGNREVSKDIAIIVIDEKSIEKLGRFPWARSVHGKMVQKLQIAGAKAVAFDSLFTESDASNPVSDAKFSKAVQKSGNVVSAFFFRKGIDKANVGQDSLFPYDALFEASSFFGFVNLDPDRDGVTRRAHLYAFADDEDDVVFPSLAVATLAQFKGQTFQDVLPDLPVVISQDSLMAKNALFVNFADPRYEQNYPMYSYADVLSGEVPLKDSFEGKAVFIGATAAALFDLKAIPFVEKYPGVKIHVNILDNLLNQNFIQETESYLTGLYILIVGLLLGFFLPRVSPWAKTGVFFGVVGSGIFFSLWLFSASNLVLPMVPPLLTGVGCYGVLLFYHLVIEEKEKRKIKGSFKQYLSPKIIEIITKDPSKLKLGGEEREATIFFLDIAGFTTMSEALKPPQLVEVMNQCLTQFSSIILKHEGLINKYIGDCIMAFWNAPADQPKHATLACQAALECIDSIPELNRSLTSRGLPSIDCRVGVNTGIVVVGNMGSRERFDYTVMGDPVNLASRLEGANKQYHTHIMISDTTFDLAQNDVEARDIDLIRVKGKKEPKKVFELLCEKNKMSRELSAGRQKYHDALRYYRQRNFEEAIHAFQEVFDYVPNDHLTRVYLERSRQFKISPPPPNWDGVYEMKTK